MLSQRPAQGPAQERRHFPVFPGYPSNPTFGPTSFPCHSGSSIQVDSRFEGSLTREDYASRRTRNKTEQNRCHVTIDILPDDVLLEIFDFYMATNIFRPDNRWQTLVHVCRTWRNVIFKSPIRLNLQLICSERTPVREKLGVWPLLPIVVCHIGHAKHSTLGVDNIVAALERNDRIRQITLKFLNPQKSESILEAMQEPFPALTTLMLSGDKMAPIIPVSSFGGSAPHLRSLALDHIIFPGLSKFLLSATHLVHLYLWNIPHSGYISPEVMATCLSVLTRLNGLRLEFESPRSHPNRESRRLLQPTRSVLPELTSFRFTGVNEYLEDLVARIDAPRIKLLEIKFFHQLIFDAPQLRQFIARTPEFKVCDQAHIYFSSLGVSVTFPRTPSDSDNGLKLAISCGQSEWQLSAMAQVCSSSFPQSLIHKVGRLYIREKNHSWQNDIENSQWLELLHPFIAAKHLYLSEELVPLIAPSFQKLMGERVTEVLPALQNLFLAGLRPWGAAKGAIREFIAARRPFNLPVAVSSWNRRNDKW